MASATITKTADGWTTSASDEIHDDFANAVDALVSSGDWDEQTGSVDELGFYGLLHDIEMVDEDGPTGVVSIIIRINSDGFKYAEIYVTKAGADKAWEGIEDDYAEYYKDNGDDTDERDYNPDE